MLLHDDQNCSVYPENYFEAIGVNFIHVTLQISNFVTRELERTYVMHTSSVHCISVFPSMVDQTLSI